MDVTKENFRENFHLFESALSQSDFVSLDAEFSGLYNKLKLNPLDEFPERYDLLRKNLKQYMLLQVGICCFRSVCPGEYICQPFNFNIFPYSCEQNKEFNTAFLCDSNTLTFLAENKFDFNKVIYSGIPFVSMLNLRSLVRQYHRSPWPRRDEPDLSPELDVINRCILSRRKEDTHTKPDVSVPPTTDHSSPLEPELLPDGTQGYLDKFLEMTSFNQILQLVCQSNKPAVFHNGFLDLFHLLKQFYGPLPEKWDDFKSMVHRFFPHIYDTKYLSCVDPFREHVERSSLSAVFEQLCLLFPVKLRFPAGFCRYEEGGEYQHEAGYDALLTGNIFGSMRLFSVKMDDYANQVFLGLQGIFFFHTTKRDPRPHRDNVLHFSTKSPLDRLSKEEITDLISPFSTVNNFWYHNSSVFIILRKSLKKAELMNLRTSCVHSKYHIMSYEEFYKAKAKIHSLHTEPLPKRNKNTEYKVQKPKYHSKYCVANGGSEASGQTLFANVDDWDS